MNRKTERPHCSRCDHHTPAYLKTPDRAFFVVDVRELPAETAAATIRQALEETPAKARRVA